MSICYVCNAWGDKHHVILRERFGKCLCDHCNKKVESLLEFRSKIAKDPQQVSREDRTTLENIFENGPIEIEEDDGSITTVYPAGQ